MATKFQLINEMYEDTLKTVNSPSNWKAFLSSACRNYKCRFDEQILIYAQRPSSTAVLEIEKWNKQFGRWVNRGATGIAVFDSSDTKSKRFKFYFDVADTHESSTGKAVPIWELSDNYHENVIETLESTFGELSDKSDIANAIISAGKNAAEDNFEDYYIELVDYIDESFLYGTGEDYASKTFKDLIANSVSYMFMERLGIDANTYFSDDDFRALGDFNTRETINTVGLSVSDIAEMGLREIARTVLDLKKKEAKQNYTFVNSITPDYNKNTAENERSFNDDRTNVQYGGRLQSTEPSNANTGQGNTHREIWDETQEISGAAPQSEIYQSLDLMQDGRIPDADRTASTGNDGNASERDGEITERDRNTESTKSDAMGADDEQYTPLSGGNSSERTDIHLENDLPTIEEQLNIIETAEEEKTSAIAISGEEIDLVLQAGSGFEDGKLRIYEQFNKNQTVSENAKFLRNEYGTGGSHPAVSGTDLDQFHDHKGMTISKGKITNPSTKMLVSWEKLARRLNNLIKADRYLNSKEKENYPVYLEEKAIRAKRLSTALEMKEFMHEYNKFVGSLEDYDNALSMYVLSDCTSCLARKVKKTHMKSMKGDYVLPLLINALEKIRDYDAKFEERATEYLEMLNGEFGLAILPDKEPEYVCDYHLGDKVYIGVDEYEINAFDENEVVLRDINYPLFTKTFERNDFDTKVKENPHNAHLLREVIEPVNEQNVSETTVEFTRVGDFYEITGSDTERIADELGLTVTSRIVNNERVPMVGFPISVADDYSQKLIEMGYTVAFSDNDEKQDIEIQIDTVKTNLGEVPIEDYREIVAIQNGFDSYDDMRNQGLHIGNGYDAPTETQKVDNSDLVGKNVEIDNRKYVIEEVKEFSGDVSMRDITFENAVGFPINRVEKSDIVRKYIVEEKEEITPNFERPKPKSTNYDLHPEIPLSQRNQFEIINDNLGIGSEKEKFRANVEAIKTLKQIENENRYATLPEQEILSRYVGFGGLSHAFEENNPSWVNEYHTLKNLLAEDEYTSAMESTLTAFYTPPVVIRSMYKALENMNFTKGNILEPSCGVGNFIGMMPNSMNESKVYGVEIDSISGRISQQLYQKSSIAVNGFEKTNLPDSFFDVAIGNVPFGQFKVDDKKYNKHNWLIHDYFFGRTLDKVRPGGVVAFITSKGTLDKANSSVRKYIAQRAELLGAIRLPNNTFTKNAGTEVTSDIIFFQKRDRIIDTSPEWTQLSQDDNGFKINSYFVNHPEMILGEMKEVSGPFGPQLECVAYENHELDDLLNNAIGNIYAQIDDYEIDAETEVDNSIPADPEVRNFSYTIHEGEIYFRENSMMSPVEVSATAENRIKGMIEIRSSVRKLIELQTYDYPDSDIIEEQGKLNTLYDNFTKKYGVISSRANSTAFSNDSSYSLLCSLEVIDENGKLERKADMFTKRTIRPHKTVDKVDTASEALAVSLGEKAKLDMEFMTLLTGKTEQELFADLKGVIFLNPRYIDSDTFPKYISADEYLSGNVREKLAWAERSAKLSPDDYSINVEALTKVQPIDLLPSEIAVRLGATWIPTEVIQRFIFELLDTPRYSQWNIKVHYSIHTSEWNIEGKSSDRGNPKASNTYGTQRINAYKIIEETLNLKDVRIFDYVYDEDGRKVAVLNKKETAIAQSKQELIKTAFTEWIWKEPNRREKLSAIYNEKFNATRPREYDGSHLTFSGMNPEIKLREHQVNAIARIIYGGNTLLAHVVGAGKTFEMVGASMEMKRLGLCNKSLFVVPNHLTEQWASEFLQLYPSANVLVASRKDFETKNRKKFCGRIATGDYDAIILGHSQFEKIPMSVERQRGILEEQLQEVLDGISESKRNRGENFTTKQLVKTKKGIELKLSKLNDQSRKDDVVTFEELGVDRLFVDESHYYKNLFLFTKMRNVGGIAQTEAQKSSDLFMKCRYLDELTGNKGIILATGTPIANTMVEMYTNQRYLQYNELKRQGLHHFDAWASTFGETVSAIELAPEGTSYRLKTRFAKFYNLPELMNMFKEVADIQTADMLNLPVPKVNFHNVAVKPSDIQKQMVEELANRAEKVRNKMVDSSVDNMLLITNDGRKLALDQRILNDMLPDFEGSKINALVNNVYDIWDKNSDKKSAQLIFSDLSTPKSDGSFSIYTDIRDKLISRGIPKEEIAFIHDADSESKKKDLFIKVRKGDVRVLLGSTQKMGAGTNVQRLLIALHDADCPWRPSDLSQRLGRIERQGNLNPEVEVFRYVTEETFDAYLYQLVENKQRFISQIMTSKSPVRSAEDIDETALSYAEIKMLATGNPHIKEKMDLDIAVSKLKLLKQNHLSERYALEDKIIKTFPKDIKFLETRIIGLEKDIIVANNNKAKGEEKFTEMKIGAITHTEKAQAGEAILAACKAKTKPEATALGEYRGFTMTLEFDTFSKEYSVNLKNEISHKVTLGSDVHGNITRIDNALDSLENKLSSAKELLENTKVQLANAEIEVKREFPQEDELKEKNARLTELNSILNMDTKDNEILDSDAPDTADEPEKNKNKDFER